MKLSFKYNVKNINSIQQNIISQRKKYKFYTAKYNI